MCHTHLDKLQIIDILDENFYDMKNLTTEEQRLFENKDYTMELLLSPLLNLVKEDIKQLEEEESKVRNFPIKTSKFNNDDQTKYQYDEAIVYENLGEEAKTRYYNGFQYMQNGSYILLGELGKPDPPPIKKALKKEFAKLVVKRNDQAPNEENESQSES